MKRTEKRRAAAHLVRMAEGLAASFTIRGEWGREDEPIKVEHDDLLYLARELRKDARAPAKAKV
jgi:hypothetical protein